MISRSDLAAGAVLLACVVAVVAANNGDDVVHRFEAAPKSVTVQHATLACPGQLESQPHSRLLAVAPSQDAQGNTGVETSLDIESRAGTRLLLAAAAPGHLTSTVELGREQQQAVLVQGSGQRAPGLAATQWLAADTDELSGLATARCLASAGEWWFTGVDTSVGRMSQVVLMNPSPATAVVSLRFFGPDGEIETAGARGIALAPYSRQVIDLARFAPGQESVTLWVVADRGRVVAAVNVVRRDTVTPQGMEWVQAGLSPAREVVVGPTLAGPGERWLAITNPGDREALVTVRMLSPSGPFAPSALTQVQISPRSVVVKDLVGIGRDEINAVQLTSNVVITASVTSDLEDGSDFAVAATSDALVEGAGAAVPVVAGADLRIVLYTTRRAGAEVSITAYDENGGQLESDTQHLVGGTTYHWVLDRTNRRSGKVAFVVVSGNANGVVVFTDPAGGVSQLPLSAGAWQITQPVVTEADH